MSKRKTFAKMCPKWAEWIRTGTRHVGYSLGNRTKCAIAEAYGWTPDYEKECKDCYNFGMRFRLADMVATGYKGYYGWGYNGESLELVALQFENHWNRVHI